MQSLWMLFASFVFAIMGVCVKLASATSSTSEIVMCRGLVGMLLIAGFARMQRVSLRTTLPWHHAWRGLVGVTALWLWFFAIGQLPLATAMTLNYMAPIWIAAIVFTLGWWHKQRRFEWGLAAAIITSFAGVALLLKPTIHAEQWLGGLLALISSFLSALAYMQVKKLGQLGEPEYRVVFYFSVSGVLAGLLSGLADSYLRTGEFHILHTLTGTDFLLLGSIGFTATIAQMAMTRAYRLGAMLVTANLQYTGIVFSSIWGILIWGDHLELSGWLGIVIILVSGVAATFYNARSTIKTAGS
ncbi:MAG: DMT family transporter [Oxalobacteraceae bacterium]|jgi:S-adenosylmethionine uptake transporter|nr:DMT family transporter [Oxalobacteraceae bacterium]